MSGLRMYNTRMLIAGTAVLGIFGGSVGVAAAADQTETPSIKVEATAVALAAAPAPIAPVYSGNWDGVAQCESGGDWHISNGNGFYGGLQFTADTWAAYGGSAYAATADGATREQQIEIAEKVLAAQGIGAWPVCGQFF